MDADAAIADLMEISSQVDAAVILAADGSVAGSSLPPEPTARLAAAARRLLEEASGGTADTEVAHVVAGTRHGSVFVIRESGRTIGATTSPTAAVGLVLYDLRTCLRTLEFPDPAPKPRRRRKKAGADAAA